MDQSSAAATSAASQSKHNESYDGRSGAHLLFEGSLLAFLEHADAPKWHESLNLFDSLSRIASIYVPSSEPRFRNLLLRFLWEDTSLQQIQFDLSLLLAYSPLLKDHFAGFLFAPLKSRAQERAARRYLCTLTGLPGTSKM